MSSNYKIIKCGRLLDLAFQLGAMTRRDCHVALLLTMTMVGLFSFNAHATCTPAPDCASIGYTKTSCETKSVKCPFDTSKLFCLPCDSSFQYSCVGDNIIGGIGSACGGKYASCECDTSLGYYFDKGVCACSDIIPTNCTVGAIYYADGRCSDDFVPCRNAIGVVVKDNELIMSFEVIYLAWGVSGNVEGLDESLTDTPEKAKTDYKGMENTSAIVAYYGESESYAAVYCNNYAPLEMENTKGLWYLPAVGELYRYAHLNYNILHPVYMQVVGGGLANMYIWSSSEVTDTVAFSVYMPSEIINFANKTTKGAVACFLNIS